MSLSILTYIRRVFSTEKSFSTQSTFKTEDGQTHTQKLKLVEQQESPNDSRFIYSRILTKVHTTNTIKSPIVLHKTGDQKQTSNVLKTCMNYLLHQIATGQFSTT